MLMYQENGGGWLCSMDVMCWFGCKRGFGADGGWVCCASAPVFIELK